VLDDMCNGLENRINQETLNIISSIGRLIQLKAEQFDIDLLSQIFSLNSDELEGEQSLLRSMPDFIQCTSTKTIYQWLENLTTSQNFLNIHKALKLFVTILVTSCSCERAFSKLSLVKTKLRSRTK